MVQIVNKTKSYHVICTTAAELFHKHGIKKVSVEELCSESGVSKMTFYRIFRNKEELVHHIILEDFNRSFNEQKDLIESELAFPQKLKAIINLKKETSKQYSKEFMVDLLNSKDQQIVKVMTDFGKKGRVLMRSFMVQNQKEGNIRRNLNIDFLMFYLAQMQEKFSSDVGIDMFGSVEEYSEELMNLIFYGIFSEE